MRDLYEGIIRPTHDENIVLVCCQIAQKTRGKNLTMSQTSYKFITQYIPTWARPEVSPSQWRDDVILGMHNVVFGKFDEKRKAIIDKLKAQGRHWKSKQYFFFVCFYSFVLVV